MTPLRRRMIDAMQLRGLSPNTQRRYVQAVQRFAPHFDKSPDQLTAEELRQYFLYLRNERRVARSTATVALWAIKFFYEHPVHRTWPTLDPSASPWRSRGSTARFVLPSPKAGSRSMRPCLPCTTPGPPICWQPGSASA